MESTDSSAASLDAKITAQGTKIRELKSQKAAKDIIETEVKTLLALKAEFKKEVGKDWDPKGNPTKAKIETRLGFHLLLHSLLNLDLIFTLIEIAWQATTFPKLNRHLQ